MMWYNNSETVRAIADPSWGWNDDHRRRSMLRLIGRTDDNRPRS